MSKKEKLNKNKSNSNTAAGQQFTFPQREPIRWSINMVLTALGPGFILAATTIALGPMVMAPRTAAWSGFSLLWVFTVAVAVKWFLAFASARYVVLTGESVFWRMHSLPGPKGWFNLVLLTMTAAMPFGYISVGGVAAMALMQLLGLQGDWRIWLILLLLISFVVIAIGRYKVFERLNMIFITFLVVGALASVVVLPIDWPSVLKGLFSFGVIPFYPEWVREAAPTLWDSSRILEVTILFSMAVGGMSIEYLMYSQYYMEKKWGMFAHPLEKLKQMNEITISQKTINLSTRPEEVYKGLSNIRPVIADVTSSHIFSFLVALLMAVAAGHLLHARQIIPAGLDLVSAQGAIYESIGFPFISKLYQAAIFFAMFSTLFVMIDSAPRGAHGFFGAFFKKIRIMPYLKWWLIIAPIILGIVIAVLLLGITAEIAMIAYGGIMLLYLPIVAGGLFWANQRVLPHEYRLGTGFIILAIFAIIISIAVVLLTVAGAAGIL